MCMVLLYSGRKEEALVLAENLRISQNPNSGVISGTSDNTIVHAYGDGKLVQTTALAVMAMAEFDMVKFDENIQKGKEVP